jgi:hypothetical protein
MHCIQSFWAQRCHVSLKHRHAALGGSVPRSRRPAPADQHVRPAHLELACAQGPPSDAVLRVQFTSYFSTLFIVIPCMLVQMAALLWCAPHCRDACSSRCHCVSLQTRLECLFSQGCEHAGTPSRTFLEVKVCPCVCMLTAAIVCLCGSACAPGGCALLRLPSIFARAHPSSAWTALCIWYASSASSKPHYAGILMRLIGRVEQAESIV